MILFSLFYNKIMNNLLPHVGIVQFSKKKNHEMFREYSKCRYHERCTHYFILFVLWNN